MKIEKMLDHVGWWSISGIINGEYFVACSDDKLDAIDRMFKKLQWNEIGSWNKNGK